MLILLWKSRILGFIFFQRWKFSSSLWLCSTGQLWSSTPVLQVFFQAITNLFQMSILLLLPWAKDQTVDPQNAVLNKYGGITGVKFPYFNFETDRERWICLNSWIELFKQLCIPVTVISQAVYMTRLYNHLWIQSVSFYIGSIYPVCLHWIGMNWPDYLPACHYSKVKPWCRLCFCKENSNIQTNTIKLNQTSRPHTLTPDPQFWDLITIFQT